MRRILTNSAEHHRGIKVELTTGIVGRVAEIIAIQSQDASDDAPAVGQRQANRRVERSRREFSRNQDQHDRNQDDRASSVMLSDFISDSLPVVPSTFSPRSLDGQIDADANADLQVACSVCTFLNSILLPSCEICGTALH